MPLDTIVEEENIVEADVERDPNKFRNIKTNLNSFVTGSIGAFIAGLLIKYGFKVDIMNPFVYAMMITMFNDFIEWGRTKSITEALRNDVGNYTGHLYGITLAYLL